MRSDASYRRERLASSIQTAALLQMAAVVGRVGRFAPPAPVEQKAEAVISHSQASSLSVKELAELADLGVRVMEDDEYRRLAAAAINDKPIPQSLTMRRNETAESHQRRLEQAAWNAKVQAHKAAKRKAGDARKADKQRG